MQSFARWVNTDTTKKLWILNGFIAAGFVFFVLMDARQHSLRPDTEIPAPRVIRKEILIPVPAEILLNRYFTPEPVAVPEPVVEVIYKPEDIERVPKPVTPVRKIEQKKPEQDTPKPEEKNYTEADYNRIYKAIKDILDEPL